ncbi:MAG: helix-turn-helix domain-containing protein [Ruminococcus sp.]|nr:helix-turn-helix domain-containing protein [Ruminococcus sp.]
METKDVILDLRKKAGLSQDELAGKVYVTRQAVSRWETGETVPNTETLKQLSGLFNVSINTLLGSPRKLICQCCGMPLDDSTISRETDNSFNEEYCKWCYADGNYTYHDMASLIDVCVEHMAGHGFTEEQARTYMKQTLPELGYWKQHKELEDGGKFEEFRRQLVDEFNALGIEGMPRVEKLNALVGSYVNLAYPLPSGAAVKLLDDNATYLGNQLEGADGRCFGVLANADFLLVSTYGKDGADPELLLFRKR